MVQEVKKALRSRPKSVPVSIHLSFFLFTYRFVPHSTTDQTPASLLFKKPPTTGLSLLQPSFAAAMQDKQQVPVSSLSREFSSGDYVWVYNARPDSKPKWSDGTVIDRLGPLTYVSCICQCYKPMPRTDNNRPASGMAAREVIKAHGTQEEKKHAQSRPDEWYDVTIVYITKTNRQKMMSSVERH